MTLFDRKEKHFNSSQTKLKLLLQILKNHCITNDTRDIRFVCQNIKHYSFPKFQNVLGHVFHENDWNFQFVDSIIKNDIFINVENNFKANISKINSVTATKKAPYKTPFVKLEVSNIPTIALIDSGATSSIIDSDFVKKFNIPIENNSKNCKLFDVSGKPLSIDGVIHANLKIGSEFFQETLFVVSSANINQPVIICCPFLEMHGFSMNFEHKTLSHKRNIVNWIPPDCIVYNELNNISLKLDEDILIPPRDSICVTLQVPHNKYATNFMLNNCQKNLFSNNCHIPDCQVEAMYEVNDNSNVYVKIENCSSLTKKFPKGTNLCSYTYIRASPAVSQYCNRLFNIINKSNELPSSHFDIDNIINEIEVRDNLQSFKNIIVNNGNAFAKSDEDIGVIKDYEHHIETTDDYPVACKPYRTPHSKIKIIEDEIDRLKKCGIIRESSSAYAAPCLIVYKKSGAPRLVVDFRRLNQKIRPIRYPLPLLESSLQLLGGKKFFSSLDLLSGYHQIPIRECDKHKTAFTSGRGLYEFHRVPFGMITSGAAMQYTMERVLGEYNNTIALT